MRESAEEINQLPKCEKGFTDCIIGLFIPCGFQVVIRLKICNQF